MRFVLSVRLGVLEREETGPRVCHLSFSLFITLLRLGVTGMAASDDQEKL